MQIVQQLAGYTLGRADLVRRAMSKKKHAVMQKERYNFVYGNEEEGVKGCIANGIDERTANHIFDEMTDFASYAFNKSHAAAYAVVSFQTAWLKYYYPAEFMAALMTSVMDNTPKASEYIQACRGMGLKMMPPDINEGDYGFTAVRNAAGAGVSGTSANQFRGTILYGLTAIKGVGRTVVEDIVRVRESSGKFTDLEDFIKRMPPSVNRKALEGFIKAGAFDSLPGNRRQKLYMMNELVDEAASRRKSEISGQITLFDIADQSGRDSFRRAMPDLPEFDQNELLAFEKEAAGIYLSGHPMEAYMESFRKIVTAWSYDYRADEASGLSRLKEGDNVISGGIVVERKLKVTKKDRQMAFLTLEDVYGQFEVLVFPDVLERFRMLTEPDSRIFVTGRASIGRDENASLLAETLRDVENIRKEIWIAFEDIQAYRAADRQLTDLCFEHQGLTQAVVYLRKEKAVKRLPKDLSVAADEETVFLFKKEFGNDNVKTRILGL